MSSNVVNQTPFLFTSRKFPTEAKELAFQMNIAYVDIANAVNERIIALFPTVRPAIGGENWFITQGKKQTSFRQVYTFTTTTPINHGIPPSDIERFTKLYGTFTDGTNWYGLMGASSVAIAGQRSFYVTPTQIILLSGGGAPTLTSGTIVLEWLSQP